MSRQLTAGLLRCLAVTLLIGLSCLPFRSLSASLPVTVLTVDGAIGPASADYVERGIARAQADGSGLIILRLDTPGGLDTSMRSIIKSILASSVPVATYVAPSGARAASAGTYLLYASHIAAMAPGTNLGAATPVPIGASWQADKDNGEQRDSRQGGSAMQRKQVNDAAAYLRGLAQMRGRNADWAEQSVREGLSLPADEAYRLGVIDMLATDTEALLVQLDGKKVDVQGGQRTLATRGSAVIDARPDWRTRLLAVITSPTIALLLLTVGALGLIFEFMSPGAVAPGVVGAICLLLALYGLQLLPVSYAGLGLLALGLGLMVAEAFLPSFGIVGLGGIAAFVAGALILIDTDVPGLGVPLAAVAMLALASAALLAATVALALRTRRRRKVGGLDDMVGSVGEIEATAAAPNKAWARLRGETWQVVSDAPLRRRQTVRVVARRGLVLHVVPVNHDKQGERK